MEPNELLKLENVRKEIETCMDSKDFDIDSLNDEKFAQHIKAETNNQQSRDSIKIEDGENIKMFDLENTRAVIKIEDENDGYEMLSGTNSFHIKVDKGDITRQVVRNEALLSSIDSIKIECNEEIKSNENYSRMRFLQKSTNAKRKLKCSKCFVILANISDLKTHRQTVHGRAKPLNAKNVVNALH